MIKCAIPSSTTLNSDCVRSKNANVNYDPEIVLIDSDMVDLASIFDPSNINDGSTEEYLEGAYEQLFAQTGAQIVTLQTAKNSITTNYESIETDTLGLVQFTHGVTFIIENKTQKARDFINTSFVNYRWVAVVRDKSQGIFEVFGLTRGLQIVAEQIREGGTGAEGNMFMINLSTPETEFGKEPKLPHMSITGTWVTP